MKMSIFDLWRLKREIFYFSPYEVMLGKRPGSLFYRGYHR